jgi:hypothetical protein
MKSRRCTGKVKGTRRRCKNRVRAPRKRCPFHSGAKKTSICWPGFERVPGTKEHTKGSCRRITKRKRRRNPSKKWKLLSIKKSTRSGKKLMATFENLQTGRTKTTHFGAAGMSDFTKHKDEARKQRYLKRHRARENWNDPTTAGALSRWILWNKKSLTASKADFKRRFGL